jgi:hypothetical protein
MQFLLPHNEMGMRHYANSNPDVNIHQNETISDSPVLPMGLRLVSPLVLDIKYN